MAAGVGSARGCGDGGDEARRVGMRCGGGEDAVYLAIGAGCEAEDAVCGICTMMLRQISCMKSLFPNHARFSVRHCNCNQ